MIVAIKKTLMEFVDVDTNNPAEPTAIAEKMYENKEVIIDKVIDVSYEAPSYPEPGNEYFDKVIDVSYEAPAYPEPGNEY